MESEIKQLDYHSDEVQEIITAVPAWIVRWGITLIFIILITITVFSALIKYPDVVRTRLKINSINAPKQILAKQAGKIIKLNISDGDIVLKNQPLAFMESVGNHEDILLLNNQLKKIQAEILSAHSSVFLSSNLELGELQTSYQNFYQQYLQYLATEKGGYYIKKISFLENELRGIKKLKIQINAQKEIQRKEYNNLKQEYEAYQKLFTNRVISRSEFKQQENKYLAANYPLQQTESSILNNENTHFAKEKELLDLQHIVEEEKEKFLLALNNCLSETNRWIKENILIASTSGKLTYAGIVQQNQNVVPGQEIFVIDPGNSVFFGEVQIPQYNMGKIRIGERTLIKLQSYPFEQYGIITGKLDYVSDIAYKDSVFMAKVKFDSFGNKKVGKKIILKNGMQADAEIITEETSLLLRFYGSIKKALDLQN